MRLSWLPADAWLLAGTVALTIVWTGQRGETLMMSGAVVDWQAGRSISIANDQTDPGGCVMSVEPDISVEGGPLGPGAYAEVWYRLVGEQSPSVIRVRILRTN